MIDKVVDSVTNPDGSDGGSSVDQAGDVITYTITVTNDGTANLTNVTVDDDLTGDSIVCALVLAAANNGGVAGTCVLTTTYTATQDDLDDNGANPIGNGLIDNTATADSVQTDPPVEASAAGSGNSASGSHAGQDVRSRPGRCRRDRHVHAGLHQHR